MVAYQYFKPIFAHKLRDCISFTLCSSCETNLLFSSTYKQYHLTSRLCLLGKSDGKEQEKPPPLDKEKAQALIMKLTDNERNILVESLKEFDALKRKEEYKGQLAAFRWRSKFGRPSKVPSLGDVDPTGSYCQLPEDWLLRKYAEIVPKPTSRQLMQVFVHNAIPFIGFGFLDNAVMILCGDYIEVKLGTIITVSTMAAAALGNTFSDILGLGSAYYVERIAASVGIKAPDLTPIQMNMSSTKAASNLGRVVGVTIGCLLGMTPLLIL